MPEKNTAHRGVMKLKKYALIAGIVSRIAIVVTLFILIVEPLGLILVIQTYRSSPVIKRAPRLKVT